MIYFLAQWAPGPSANEGCGALRSRFLLEPSAGESRLAFRTALAKLALALLLTASLSSPTLSQVVIRGPYLQKATPTSITVRWRTDIETDSVVDYGETQGLLLETAMDSAQTTEHEVELSGLDPGTRYYYSIGGTGQVLAGNDASHFFVTSPTVGSAAPQRIWVLGDSGGGGNKAEAVRDAYLDFAGNSRTQTWLMLGDNAYNDGDDDEYQEKVFETYPTLLRTTALWPAFGNHDGSSASSEDQSGVYYDIFSLPKEGEAGGVASDTEAYYSFDVGNVHFVCLDSDDSDRSSDGAMMQWLAADLNATTRTWIVAFWHHPPYSKGSHDSDSESRLRQMRENALPILEAHGVDLVLAGHSHSYERSFLIDGHYGDSTSFEPETMLVDDGDGNENGSGAYSSDGPGAVYMVAGSSSRTSDSGDLDHPVMSVSVRELGSVVIDVAGDRMDVLFLRETGTVDDLFSLTKGTLMEDAFESGDLEAWS